MADSLLFNRTHSISAALASQLSAIFTPVGPDDAAIESPVHAEYDFYEVWSLLHCIYTVIILATLSTVYLEHSLRFH